MRRCGGGRERILRDNGYTCDGACDARTARALLSEESYKLALLDVNMPGESGIELLSELRRDYPLLADRDGHRRGQHSGSR